VRAPPTLAAVRTLSALLSLAAAALPAFAARVVAVSPQGEVAAVRQVSIRFDESVVPAGDPRLPAPFTLQCNGSAPAGDARWADARTWLFDLREVLPPGQRCVLRADAGWKPLRGALDGPTDYQFNTAPLGVVSVRPYPGSRIDEEQHFLLRFNGAVTAAQAGGGWCEVQGTGERIARRASRCCTRSGSTATAPKRRAGCLSPASVRSRPMPAFASCSASVSSGRCGRA